MTRRDSQDTLSTNELLSANGLPLAMDLVVSVEQLRRTGALSLPN